jgi:hypothetical protein
MQHLPHTTCPDPFHHAHSMEEQDATGVELTDQLGDFQVIAFGCRTCGFQNVRRVTQTWLDKVPSTCPGCDAIDLVWDDEVGDLCLECDARGVRTVLIHLEHIEGYEPIAEYHGWPTTKWTWGQVIEAMA